MFPLLSQSTALGESGENGELARLHAKGECSHPLGLLYILPRTEAVPAAGSQSENKPATIELVGSQVSIHYIPDRYAECFK